MSDREPPEVPDPGVGLCRQCRHASVQRSARGSSFWRCRRADQDPAFPRYPPLPVESCRGFESDSDDPDSKFPRSGDGRRWP